MSTRRAYNSQYRVTATMITGAIFAVCVVFLAVLYGIALLGDHPVLDQYLRGLGADRSTSNWSRALFTLLGLCVVLYSIFIYNGDGSFGAPMGSISWWMGVAVAIFAIVLVTSGLLRSIRQND